MLKIRKIDQFFLPLGLRVSAEEGLRDGDQFIKDLPGFRKRRYDLLR